MREIKFRAWDSTKEGELTLVDAIVALLKTKYKMVY